MSPRWKKRFKKLRQTPARLSFPGCPSRVSAGSSIAKIPKAISSEQCKAIPKPHSRSKIESVRSFSTKKIYRTRCALGLQSEEIEFIICHLSRVIWHWPVVSLWRA
jgi:hypothetical protein